jgi:hypothetical protein
VGFCFACFFPPLKHRNWLRIILILFITSLRKTNHWKYPRRADTSWQGAQKVLPLPELLSRHAREKLTFWGLKWVFEVFLEVWKVSFVECGSATVQWLIAQCVCFVREMVEKSCFLWRRMFDNVQCDHWVLLEWSWVDMWLIKRRYWKYFELKIKCQSTF